MSFDMFPDSAIEYLLTHQEDTVADHGDNYTRDEKSKGSLGPECGHHCGVITTGSHAHKGHCGCPECHNTNVVKGELPTQFTSQSGGIDPRGIS